MQYEFDVQYIRQPGDLEVESDEFNEMLVRAMNTFGVDGWEIFQVNTLMSGEKIRLYMRRPRTERVVLKDEHRVPKAGRTPEQIKGRR